MTVSPGFTLLMGNIDAERVLKYGAFPYFAEYLAGNEFGAPVCGMNVVGIAPVFLPGISVVQVYHRKTVCKSYFQYTGGYLPRKGNYGLIISVNARG